MLESNKLLHEFLSLEKYPSLILARNLLKSIQICSVYGIQYDEQYVRQWNESQKKVILLKNNICAVNNKINLKILDNKVLFISY
jgi:hypothetical protein